MPAPDLKQCRRILEVADDATREEITHAYHQLKRIHGKEPGLAIHPTMEEFAPEIRQEVMEEIEAAYALLQALPAETPPPAPPEEVAVPVEASERPALSSLAKARIAAGLTLDQVAQETCVRREYLKALEEEHFEDLNLLAPVNVRGYLNAFAIAVGVPADVIVPVYMKRFTDWMGLRR